MKIGEIRPLTSFRFIAALLVFLFHFLGFSGKAETLWQGIGLSGYIGVTLFFVLSGFLICLRYFVPAQDGTLSFGQYIFKRIARIWPLYYFLLALVLIAQQSAFFYKDTLIHLTLTQGYFMKFVTHDIPTSWSLTVEETFYLLAPLLFWIYGKVQSLPAFRARPRLIVLTGYLAIINLIFPLAGLLLQRISVEAGIVSSAGFMGGFGISGISTIQNTTIFFRIFEFTVGIWCAVLYTTYLHNRWWQAPSTKWIATLLFILCVIGIIVLEFFMSQFGGMYGRKGFAVNYLVAIVAGLMILSLTRPDTIPYKILSLPLFVYLGRISYALYLIQQIAPLIDVTKVLGTSLGIFVPTGEGFYPVWLLYVYVIMSILSVILYETVEKYGGRLVMAGYRRFTSARAGA